MADRLGGALLTVVLGFVTGAIWAVAAAIFVGRRLKYPDALTRRATAYLYLAVALAASMTLWLLVWPWL